MQREFFANMYDTLLDVEMSRDYYKAIILGDWPDSDELIAQRRSTKK